MTVSDLIKFLADLPGDAEVLTDTDGAYRSVTVVRMIEYRTDIRPNHPDAVLIA